MVRDSLVRSADQNCTSRTMTSVCEGSAANMRTGWFKHPSSIALAAKWCWLGISCFEGSHTIAPAEYIVENDSSTLTNVERQLAN
jgi:hypothetical protein